MKVTTEYIPAQPMVFMRRIGAYGPENFKLMEAMKEWINARHLWGPNSTLYGIAQDDASVTPAEKCRYDVCLAIEEPPQDDSIQQGTLMPGMYLVFEVPHTSAEVQRFWENVLSSMAQEKQQWDGSRPILERYQVSLIEKGLCEFCVPVRIPCK